MLVIRLTRTGRKKQPNYRVVVAEKSAPIQGRVVEVLGHYNPRSKELVIDKDQAQKRLQNGAQPTDTAEALLEKAGVLKRGKLHRRPERAKKNPVEETAPVAPAAASSSDDTVTDDSADAATEPTVEATESDAPEVAEAATAEPEQAPETADSTEPAAEPEATIETEPTPEANEGEGS